MVGDTACTPRATRQTFLRARLIGLVLAALAGIAALGAVAPPDALAIKSGLDPDFGTDGLAASDRSGVSTDDYAFTVVKFPGGGYVARGYAPKGGTAGLVPTFTKFLDNGSVDTAWGTNGSVQTARASGIAVGFDGGGRMIVARRSGGLIRIHRFTAAGAVDTAFGGGTGIEWVAIPPIEHPGAGDWDYQSYDSSLVAVDSAGRVYAAGAVYAEDLGNDTYREGGFVARFVPGDGGADAAYGSAGISYFEAPVESGWGSRGLVLDEIGFGADGSIALTADWSGDTAEQVAVVKLDPSGAVDGGFGADGVAFLTVPGSHDYPSGTAVSVDSSGRVLVAVVAENETTSYGQALVARMSASGVLEAGFGTGGFTVIDPSGLGRPSVLNMVLTDGDGNVVGSGGGYDDATVSPDTDTLLVQLEPDGDLDPGFGIAGVRLVDILDDGGSDQGYESVLDGEFLVAAVRGVNPSTRTDTSLLRVGVVDNTPVPDTTPPAIPTVGVPAGWSKPDGSGVRWGKDRTPTVNISTAGEVPAGYSVTWTKLSGSIPPATINLGGTATSATSAELEQGLWYVHARSVDADGNWSGTRHAGPYGLDTAPASRSLPGGDAVEQRWWPTTNVPISFKASDSGDSGIVSYRLQRRYGRQGVRLTRWQTWKTVPASTRFMSMPAGQTTCLRASAVDRAGNTSPLWGGTRCTTVATPASRFKRNQFSLRKARKFPTGSRATARKRGARLVADVTAARWIALLATTCRSCGKVDVYLNGKRVKRINLRSRRANTAQPFTVFVGRSYLQKSKLEVRVVSKRGPVQIDGAVISSLTP